MIEGETLEVCVDPGEACLKSGHGADSCHDCDGLGSVGALPCGRCAGSGTEPTSPLAAATHQGVRTDFGAIWSWRSRVWLLDGIPLEMARG
jgi:hypothetical protein